MQKQIEELRRKAEQGSQQLQGEVQELQLESVLRDAFPRDAIEAIPKGEYGATLFIAYSETDRHAAAQSVGVKTNKELDRLGLPNSVAINAQLRLILP